MTLWVQPVKDKWGALEKTQKFQILGVIAALIVILAVAIFFMTRTNWVSLFDNPLPRPDITQAATVMGEHGIRHRIGPDGTILEIDRNRLTEAIVLVGTQNVLPHTNFSYEDALAASGLGATETLTRANLARATVTGLESALMLLDGINRASVQLHVPPESRHFIQGGPPASASVILNTTHRFSRQEGQNIARFLASSVGGLELQNIEIIDANGGTIFSGMDIDSDDPEFDPLIALRQREQMGVESQIRSILAGFETVGIMTNLFYDSEVLLSRMESILEPPIPGAVSGVEYGTFREDEIEMSGLPNPSAFAPGLESLDATFPQYPLGGTQGEFDGRRLTREGNLGFNEIISQFTAVAPSFDRDRSSLSVSVWLDVYYHQATWARNNGGNTSQEDWEDFKVNNAQRRVMANQAERDALAEQIIPLLIAGTGVQNVSVAFWEIPNFVDYVPAPAATVQQLLMYGLLILLLLLLLFGIIRGTRREEEGDLEPELSVEDLLVSTQLEEAQEEEANALEAIGYQEDSDAKRLVEAFVDEKPEAAASLLRHWINEEELG
jgi:flagellar M-ring protein FliF